MTLEKAALSDSQFDKLRDLIYQVSGMAFPDNKKYLIASRLGRRLEARGLDDFDQYHYFLTHDPRRQEEFTFLFNEITTNETSFFRNAPQIKAFQQVVLSKLIEEKLAARDHRIRIWSAACSSGEEPYTIAICLFEALGESVRDWRLEIQATDISTEMLEKGKRGVYGHYTMRATPLAMRHKYFNKCEEDEFEVKEELRRITRFSFLNFSDDAGMRRQRGFDIVFCRNVLIYFDLEAKQRYVKHIWEALNPGGHLFLGHAESLHKISQDFTMVTLPAAVAYQKPG